MTHLLEQRGHLPNWEDSAFHTRLLTLADRDPRRAARLAYRWFGAADKPADAAWAQYLLGRVLLRWERVPAARTHLEAAQRLFAAQGDAAMSLRCQYALLVARQLAGAGVVLQTAWQELIDAFAGAELPRDAARARCEQIAHLNVLGRPADARS